MVSFRPRSQKFPFNRAEQGYVCFGGARSSVRSYLFKVHSAPPVALGPFATQASVLPNSSPESDRPRYRRRSQQHLLATRPPFDFAARAANLLPLKLVPHP
jgi:hypothetical protein